MNLFEQMYNDNQDVEEVAFKCVSNALGPDLMKALTIITHDVRDHIVVIIRKVPEDADFNELFSTIHSNAMDSGLFDDVAWETDGEETTMFLNFIKAEKTLDGRDFTGTDVVPGEDYFDECCKTKRNRITEANGHETTDYEEAGWELVNNAIDSFEYSDRQVDRIHIKAKDTGDTVIVHVTGMPKVAKKRLSDFIDDNLTKAGFKGTSRVGVFGDEVTVELWKDFDECGEMDESGMMDNGNAGNAGTADGFAAFLTRKGFDFYEAGTMENQGDVDAYEGAGNFKALFDEYMDTETNGTRNFVCATADSRYWYVSSSYDSDEELMDDLAEDDPSSLDVDFCVVCYGA